MKTIEQPKSPRQTANCLSCLTFALCLFQPRSWIIPLFIKGYQKDLAIEEIYRIVPDDDTEKLADRMEAAWFEQVAKTEAKKKKKVHKNKKMPTPSLIKALVKVFGPTISAYGICAWMNECVIKVVQPIILGYLLDYFHSPEEFELYHGYLFAFGVVMCSVSYMTSDHPFTFAVQHLGMQMRISLTSLIYRKSLRVSKFALEQTTAGQIINFLSSDMNRFDIFFTFCHYIWVAPLQLVIVMGVLYMYVDLGVASLAGLLLIILFVPFQGYMGFLFGQLRSETATKTDERLIVLEEILSAMRVIKMYTWEKPFSDTVTETRNAEVKKLRKTAMCKALNQSFFSITSRTTLFITLLTYVLTGHILTAKKVYMTLALYQSVQYVMTLFFPLGVISLAETLVALTRIKTFLVMEERTVPLSAVKDANVQRVRKYDWCLAGRDDFSITSEYTVTSKSFASTESTIGEIGVWARDITAQWNPTTKEMCFNNVTFDIKGGQILALIGPTASGKSSVLFSLLYELPLKSGEFRAMGKVALTCQEPWIFNASVRENILFGKPYNSMWYDEVTEACALTKDFQLLPYGDRTIVGEKGAALSGGQKARVTLARSVYADADIYLLDDPLSAVDAQVGRHIMEKCIMGVLKNKCRILVTNQLQHVRHVDEIILMIDGYVAYKGGYKSLQKSGIPFSELLNTSSDPGGNLQKPKPGESMKSLVAGAKSSSVAALVVSQDKTPLMDTAPQPVTVPNASEEKEDMEEMATGNIGLRTYYTYFHAGSSLCTVLVLLIMTFLTQCLFTRTDMWLQFWVDTEKELTSNNTAGLSHNRFVRIVQTNSVIRTIIYSCLIFALFVTFLTRTQNFYRMCMKSSEVVYDRLFYGVLRSPMRFFDSTPVGRILNRFAKDISIIDENLPQTLYDCMEILMQTLGILILIGYNSPVMLGPCVVLLVIFYYLRKFYFRTARTIKRLEGVARSPIFNHLSASLNGLPTIRAFDMEQKFLREFESIHDVHNSVWYLFLAGNRWLGITVDWVTIVFISGVALNFLLRTESMGDAVVGVCITSSMMLTSMVQWGMRQSAEMENHLIAFERVQEYCNLQPEAALESAPENEPPATWPSYGEIRIQNLCLRYREDSPVTVLKNISCTINGGEKVGIVGRTGAGKSSLIAVLFRLAEPTSGYIEIDGVETTSIGLHDLRSKISIIPQEPVIFMGTVRKNLDPLYEYTDAEIWNSLQEVKLTEAVKSMEGGLDSEIAEGGSNFSLGQKQLFCLARAILKSNKILVLDEATASIDPETYRLIQKTIRRNFGDCTVLTIAHRLHTVMDSDRILVLNAGQIMEFDEPQVLLSNRHSMLYQLVQQTGKTEASNLAQIARFAALKRRKPASQTVSKEQATGSHSSTSSEADDVDDVII